MADVRTLYDEDFVTWTEQQAEALRSASRGSTNQPVDWENLAEEIESLGKSDRRELRSQIYRVVRHLAKLQFSPAAGPRDGCRDSVTDGRKRAELILADSPSLTSQLDQFVSEEGPAAVERAVVDLDEFGELNRQTEQALRSTRYTVDQILGNWFPTAPQRSAGRGKRGR
jgi:predicted RNA-binding protein